MFVRNLVLPAAALVNIAVLFYVVNSSGEKQGALADKYLKTLGARDSAWAAVLQETKNKNVPAAAAATQTRVIESTPTTLIVTRHDTIIRQDTVLMPTLANFSAAGRGWDAGGALDLKSKTARLKISVTDTVIASLVFQKRAPSIVLRNVNPAVYMTPLAERIDIERLQKSIGPGKAGARRFWIGFGIGAAATAGAGYALSRLTK
jgi:hypothetical protein